MSKPTFDEYVSTLGRLSEHVDPTIETVESGEIRLAARTLAQLPEVNVTTLRVWASTHPDSVPVLGLTVGLSQEKLKNSLRDALGTTSWRTLACDRPQELVEYLDDAFGLVRLVEAQRHRTYDFGDLLVARAGTRGTALRAGRSGRGLEDEIEHVAMELGLDYALRGRFTGRNGNTAPADLIVPSTDAPAIVVAAKGFDSTGSKLTDAVREIVEMAEVRLPRQTVYAVIDGIGWKGRMADLRRIHELWMTDQIDGMYTLGSLDSFRLDLHEAARLRGLLPDDAPA